MCAKIWGNARVDAAQAAETKLSSAWETRARKLVFVGEGPGTDEDVPGLP